MKYSLLANGRRIVFYTSGRAKNVLPLVFLHGFCEDSSLWQPVLPCFKATRTVRIDLPGFGGSDEPLAPGMEGYADAVCAILNEMGIEYCILAGHSMGGYAALTFARNHPERLAGLALVHSHPYEDSPERKENRQRAIEMVLSGKKDLYVAQLFPGLFAPAFAREHPEVVQALIRLGRRQPAAGIVAALEGMVSRKDEQETLRTLPCPVLFLLGDQDSIIPPGWVLQVAHLPAIADIQLLAGVGHMGMFEAPVQTGTILSNFWQFCTSRLAPSSK